MLYFFVYPVIYLESKNNGAKLLLHIESIHIKVTAVRFLLWRSEFVRKSKGLINISYKIYVGFKEKLFQTPLKQSKD